MSTNWRYRRVFSNLGYFGSGIIAATVVSSTYTFKSTLGQEINERSKACSTSGSVPPGEQVSMTPTASRHHQKATNFQSFQDRLDESIKNAEKLCERVKAKHGLPGLSVAVSVNGRTEWERGFGYSDLENEVKMEAGTVLRIASISKSMTMAMLGKFMEEKKVDLDLPVQAYVPNFPVKQVDGKEVTITTRHLLSHLSGIRHYSTKEELDANPKTDEMELKEYFLKEKFETVEKALALFQNDQLLHEPGTKFVYTTHGWTLVSAVIEKVSGTPFDKFAKSMFKTWGLKNTFLDEPEPIIYSRARPYSCDKKGGIQNSPYVDNSYKWAGGGFLSTVGDVVQFGNIMLSSFQNQSPPVNGDNDNNSSASSSSVPLPQQQSRPYLKSDTVAEMWRGDPRTFRPVKEDFLYGLAFYVAEPMRKCFFCRSRDLMTVTHSGAAIGGSSVLLLTFPKDAKFGYDEPDQQQKPPATAPIPNGQVKGVAVSMITNLTDVGLTETAQEITKLFEWLI